MPGPGVIGDHGSGRALVVAPTPPKLPPQSGDVSSFLCSSSREECPHRRCSTWSPVVSASRFRPSAARRPMRDGTRSVPSSSRAIPDTARAGTRTRRPSSRTWRSRWTCLLNGGWPRPSPSSPPRDLTDSALSGLTRSPYRTTQQSHMPSMTEPSPAGRQRSRPGGRRFPDGRSGNQQLHRFIIELRRASP